MSKWQDHDDVIRWKHFPRYWPFVRGILRSPVYKKENNLKRDNYRPLSILTVISKLYHFYVLFNELLAAFRKSYSCQTLLIEFIEDLKSALDKGHKIGTVYMDLSKAFDCLPHGLLIAKLNAYGLSEAACETMLDYLKGREQRVEISNHRSSWKELNKGVPQGSILGPFLFNGFINDLFLFIDRCKLYNNADDNSIMYSSPDLSNIFTNLQTDCNNAIDWFTANGMKANPSKFQFMMISNERIQQQCLNIGSGIILRSEPSVKVLGVTIDDRLQFSEHISACCLKASRQFCAFQNFQTHQFEV